MRTKFYEFWQNNSGGIHLVDDKVNHVVWIEAHDANHANHIATTIGIYFDGTADGRDCECCGCRWYRADEGNSKDQLDPHDLVSPTTTIHRLKP